MESKKQSVNTFVKGMDKDIDISLISKQSYIDAHNFRLVTSTGNTSMSLESVDGNLITQSIPTGFFINGYCCVRNTLVLFIVEPSSDTTSRILTCQINDHSIGSFTTVYDDHNNLDGSRLNFNINYPIQAIGRYETNLIQKVYFCDGIIFPILSKYFCRDSISLPPGI